MRFSELLRTAYRSLASNRKRSFLTMIGIIIGIAAVITIMSLGNGVKVSILKSLQTDQSGQQQAKISYLPDDYSSKVKGFNQDDLQLIQNQINWGVVKVKISPQTDRVSVTTTVFNENQDLNLTATKTPIDKKILFGQNWTKADNQVENQVAVISQALAKKIFKSNQQAVDGAIVVNGLSYRIVGVYQGDEFDPDLYVPQATYLAGSSQDQGDEIEITYQKGTDIGKSSKRLVSLLKDRGSQRTSGSYQYFDMGDLLKGIGSVINALTYFVAAIAGISLFIAGIGVMNMMYISVSERTQEIGIRLAVGATPKNIMSQFLLEAVLLTVIGGLIGYGLGAAFADGISSFLPFKAFTTLSDFFLAFTVSTLVGVIFGLLPAKQAANKNLIDILR